MKKRSEIKDFIWNAVGLSFNAFNSLFFLIAVKYINGMDDAGIFTYAFSLCCLFYTIACYFNRTFQVSSKEKIFSYSDFMSARLIFSAVSFILIIIFSLISGFSLMKIFVIALLMIFRIVEAISDCAHGALQKDDKLYQTGISLFMKSLIGLAAFVLVDLLTGSILLALTGLIIANSVIFLLYDYKNVKKFAENDFSFSSKNILKIAKTCLPVMVFSLLATYIANSQKYVLTYFESDFEQAIFGILIMPASVMSLAGSYLINPFTVKLTNYFHSGDKNSFTKTCVSILLIMFGVGTLAIAVAYFAGIPVLNFIYSVTLDEYQTPLTLIVVAAMFYAMALIISSFLTILDDNKSQVVMYIVASAFSTVLSIVLIENNGIGGAVIAFLASGVLLALLYGLRFCFSVSHKIAEK